MLRMTGGGEDERCEAEGAPDLPPLREIQLQARDARPGRRRRKEMNPSLPTGTVSAGTLIPNNGLNYARAGKLFAEITAQWWENRPAKHQF